MLPTYPRAYITSVASPTLAFNPSNGDISYRAFNEELPPPTVIIFIAFSPTTKMRLVSDKRMGNTLFLFCNNTMPSSAILRAAEA